MKSTLSSAALLLCALLTGCPAPEERAADYLANARNYLEQDQLARASVELKNALQIDPALVEAHYLQATLYERTRNWSAYRDSLRRVIDLEPRHFDAQLKLGTFAALNGDFDEADAAARAALDIRPSDPTANALMGAVLLQQHEIERATEYATRALTTDPQNAEAISLQASVDLEAQRLDEAAELLRAGIESHPDNPLLRMQLIRIEEARGKPDAVAAAFRDLIAQQRTTLQYYEAFASYYVRSGQRDTAEAVLREAIEHTTDPVAAKLALAGLLAESDPRRAAKQLEEFIATDRGAANALKFGLAQLYVREGKTDGAEALYRAIVEANDDDANVARNQLAQLEIQRKRLSEASGYIEDTLAHDPGNTDALVLRASVQLARGHTDEAVATLRQVLRDAPDSVKALNLLGEAYLSQRAVELAQSTFLKALEVDPRNTTAAHHLAAMLMEREEFADADALLSRVFQLDPSDPRTAQMLVRAKLALQQWNEAKAVVARVAPGNENSALASTYIDGLALQAGGDYNGSTRAFERLLGHESSSGVAIKGIARNFRLMDAPPDAAREYFEKLIDTQPDQQQAYLSLAEQYSALRRWDDATKVLRTAIARHADWIPVYRALATVQIARGDLDGALATQRRIVEHVPDDVEARLYVAGIVEKQGKLVEATRLYGEVLDLDSGNDIAANNLAALLIRDGKPDAETLDRAYALARRFESTRVPEFADTLGWIYVLRNNYPKGIEYLERASAGAPNSAEIQYHLGAAYLRSRDASRARDHLERSLALAETGRQHPAPGEAREMLQQL